MTLNMMDQDLLRNCVNQSPRSWEDFVDRYISMVSHVVDYVASNRKVVLPPEERDLLIETVFTKLHENQFHILKQIKGKNHLSTYLAIISRRIVVEHFMNQSSPLFREKRTA